MPLRAGPQPLQRRADRRSSTPTSPSRRIIRTCSPCSTGCTGTTTTGTTSTRATGSSSRSCSRPLRSPMRSPPSHSASAMPNTKAASAPTGPTTSSNARAPTLSSTHRSGPTPATSPRPCTWGEAGPKASAATTPKSPRPGSSPDVVVLPDAVDDPNDPLAWIGFEGRWGERHAAPNNGPTGPNTKPQWTEPVTWHDDLRDSSFVVPTGDTRGTELIDTFCGVVAWGSVQFINFVASPARVLFVLALLTALAVFLVRRTSWGSVGPVPLARRRRAGEIARVAGVLYRRHPGTFTAVGAIAVPVSAVALLVSAVIERLPFIGDLVTVSDTEGTGGRLVIASSIAGLFGIFAFLLISAAVAWIVGGPHGIRASAGDALQAVGRRSGRARGRVPPRRGRHPRARPRRRRRPDRDLAVRALAVHPPGHDARRARRAPHPGAQRRTGAGSGGGTPRSSRSSSRSWSAPSA